jgi:hypothetical protein
MLGWHRCFFIYSKGYLMISEKELLRRIAMAERNSKHGMTGTPEYHSWVGMIQRCHNPKATGYHNYGARGISVCERWRNSFSSFHDDMGPRPPGTSLDRINNNGNYEPGNCRWTTASEQKRNSRTARHLTFRGETKTIAAWAEIVGISRLLIRKRIAAGWDTPSALTRQSHKGKPCPTK